MSRLILKEISFNYANRHLFDMLDLLVEKYNFKFITKEELLRKDFIQNINHLLLITGSSQIKDFNVAKDTKISYIIDDLHTGGSIKRGRINSKDRVFKIFATYGYCFDKFFPMISKEKVLWFPHSARYIIPFNKNPINKILLSGRINPNQYPNRNKLFQISKNNNFIYYEKPKLNGYRANNENDIKNRIYGKKYYELLNKYLICFTCDANSERPYIVAKHFEIMASGSLLLSCNPYTKKYFEELGFKDEEEYISCNSENMIEKIKWLQDSNNQFKINKIRLNGYNKVKKYHTWEKRAEIINQILN